jgi:hypothetical protein
MKVKFVILVATLYLAHSFGQSQEGDGESRIRGPGGPGGPGGSDGTTPTDQEETTSPEAGGQTSSAAPVNDDPSANIALDEPPPGVQSGSARRPGGPGGPGASGAGNVLTNAQAEYLNRLTLDLQQMNPSNTKMGTVERAMPPSSRPRPPGPPGGTGGPQGPGGPSAKRGFWNWLAGIFFNTEPKCCCLWYSFKTSRWRYTVCLKWC